MNLLQKIFIYFSITLLILYYLQKPQYQGQVFHKYKKYGKINIYREKSNGIPHIEGESINSVCYGQGFVHAQDRLLQLHLKRQMGKGRMSEFAGESVLKLDKMMRQIGIHRISQQYEKELSDQARECLQAYADGVNSYADELIIFPYEFSIIGSKWERWEIVDSIVIQNVLMAFLSTDAMFELHRTEAAKIVGEEKAREYFAIGSEYQFKNIEILDDDELKSSDIYQRYEKIMNRRDIGDILKDIVINLSQQENNISDPAKQRGSNAWVISGEHTKSGKPIVASDPHLPTGMPCNWYQQELLYEVDGVKKYQIGVSMVGIPYIFIGKQDFFSMGITALMADVADYYYEELNTEEKTYKVDGQNRQLKVYKEQIKIKGKQEPHELELYETHRGPVVSVLSSRKSGFVDTAYLTYCWTGKKANQIFDIYIEKMKVDNQQDLQKVLHGYEIPVLTVPYATKNNDIGMVGVGQKPLRKDPISGAFIQDGRSSEGDWQGYMDPKDWPQVFNPKKGYINNANNKYSSDNIKHYQSLTQISTARAYTIQNYMDEKIKNKEKITIGDMMELQCNVEDSYVKEVLPNLIKLFRRHKDQLFQNQEQQYQEKISVILQQMETLEQWDYKMTPDSVEASIMNVWLNTFTNKIFQNLKENEETRQLFVNSILLDQFLFRNLEKFGKNQTNYEVIEDWCQSESEQNCLVVLFDSLYEAKQYLNQKLGENDQRYGKLHKQTFPHQTFSKAPLRVLYDRYFRGYGNHRTIAVSTQNLPQGSYDSNFGANLRYLDDMGGKSYWILDQGISENVFSQYYDDQLKLYEKSQYMEMKYGYDRLEEYELLLELVPPVKRKKNRRKRDEQ